MESNSTNEMKPIEEEKFNPWFSMWLQPRYTIRRILDSYNKGPIILLAVLYGIANTLSGVDERNAFNTLFGILSMAIISGAIGGIIGLYIASGLVKWTGKWIGGQGSYEDIKTAIAWANVPVIWSLILWTLGIIIFGVDFFKDATLLLQQSILLNALSWFFSIAFVIIDIWTLFTAVKCVAEAQQFSSWKAFANLLLAFLVLFIPLMIIALISFI